MVIKTKKLTIRKQIILLIQNKNLDLGNLRDRNVEDLSGGELQRFACAVSCIRNSDMYFKKLLLFFLFRNLIK